MLQRFLITCLLLIPEILSAQTASIKGLIRDGREPIPFVNVGIDGTNRGAATDINGRFEIANLQAGSYLLKVSAVGYESWNQNINLKEGEIKELNIFLKKTSQDLKEVVVTGTMKESFLKDSPIKVEVLTPKLFQASPASNVIEAVQAVNGVREQINCGICGTNDIHINGMEGPYTLVMIDGMPIVSALASVYGFNGIPLNLIERIEVVKGPASSLYGSEAMGGVINIITRRPSNMKGLNLNSYYTSHDEANLDLSGAFKAGKNDAFLLSANGFRNQRRIDRNADGFTDLPTSERLSGFGKWEHLRPGGRTMSLAARVYAEDRFGGEMDWTKNDRGGEVVYGESIYTRRYEVIGNYTLPLRNNPLRLDLSWNQHKQDSYYGSTPFMAEQRIFFSNLVYDKSLKNHEVLAGFTFRHQYYDDGTVATTEPEIRYIPGIFVQEEYKYNKKGSVLGGLRVDHHEEHGFVFTPRLAFSYRPDEWTTFRLNAGKGFRLVNLFTEDHAALTGARDVVIAEKLKPEESYTLTLSLNRVYAFILGSGTWDADVFITRFNNRILPDYSIDPNEIHYANLDGHGIVRGMSLSADHAFTTRFRSRLGATLQDAYLMEPATDGTLHRTEQDFTPLWTGQVSVSYDVEKPKLKVELSSKVTGPQYLPVFPEPFARATRSPVYTMFDLQVSRKISKKIGIYAGARNLLDYTQDSPLIDPANPFGPNFDTTYAYGPLQGRRFFFGLRVE